MQDMIATLHSNLSSPNIDAVHIRRMYPWITSSAVIIEKGKKKKDRQMSALGYIIIVFFGRFIV